MLKIGVSNFTYALISADTVAGGTIYGTPTDVAGLNNIKLSAKFDQQDYYADNVLFDSMSMLGRYEVEIKVADLDLDTQAALLGHTVTGGVLERLATDQPPVVGIAFKAKKSNGKYRYTRLLKGRFSVPDDENATREDKIKLADATIKGVFYARVSDDKVIQQTDEDQANFNSATAAAWFTAFGAADSTPPSISSVTPANSATGVAVGTTVAWVFNEALQPTCMTKDNFFLVKDSDGSIVAGTLALSNGNKTVTFTPSGNLTAAAVYRPVVGTGVKDLAGNALAAQSVTKFTCA